jgi:hypothetical protein
LFERQDGPKERVNAVVGSQVVWVGANVKTEATALGWIARRHPARESNIDKLKPGLKREAVLDLMGAPEFVGRGK